MIFHSESHESRWKRISEWHAWYAWRPVRCGDRIVWLQWIFRRMSSCWASASYWNSSWEYELPGVRKEFKPKQQKFPKAYRIVTNGIAFRPQWRNEDGDWFDFMNADNDLPLQESSYEACEALIRDRYGKCAEIIRDWRPA